MNKEERFERLLAHLEKKGYKEIRVAERIGKTKFDFQNAKRGTSRKALREIIELIESHYPNDLTDIDIPLSPRQTTEQRLEELSKKVDHAVNLLEKVLNTLNSTIT